MSKSNHTSVVILLLIFLIGGGIGYMANHFVASVPLTSYNVDSILNVNREQSEEIESLRNEVGDLNEAVDELLRQIESKNETISELNRALIYGASNESEQNVVQ